MGKTLKQIKEEFLKKREEQDNKKENASPEATNISDASISSHENCSTRLKELQDWAKAYRQIGFNPLPCFSNAKNPKIEWKVFQEQEIQLEVVLNNLEENDNLGVTQSNVKYVIIDFDDVETMKENFVSIIDFDSKTLIANTKKGFHMLCKAKNYEEINRKYFELHGVNEEEDSKGLKVVKLKGGEIRIKGNTIVPPSITDNVMRNWYYLSLNEALTVYHQSSFDKLKPLGVSEFLSYIENDELIELDLTNFTNRIEHTNNNTQDKEKQTNEKIEDLEELKQQIIKIVVPHWKETQRHDIALRLASFLKYRLATLGLTLKEAYDFTVSVITEIVKLANDDEIQDRLRAVEDTFNNRITEHNSLYEYLGNDYDRLKALIRRYRKQQSLLKSYTELDDIVKQVSQDLRAVTYEDNKFVLWFANGDNVEYSEKTLFTYVVQTYKFHPKVKNKKEENFLKWRLYKKLEPIVAERRVKKLRWFHEGIHALNPTEFLIVLSDDDVYVYNVAFDDYYRASKVQGNALIEVRNVLKDFDSELLEKYLSMDKQELLLLAKRVWNELASYIKHWNFEREESVRALASLLLILPLHTAWKWRCILHFYGAAGSGKTTFFEFVFRTIYPSLCVQRSDTSKAGLLQAFSNTSYIALFDNLETSQLKKQDFFTVLEGASSGFEEVKGTKDGKGITYTYRNLTIINSVKDFVQKEALDTRTIQFVLHRPTSQRPDALSETLAVEYATISLAFALRFWKEISEIYNELAKKGRAYQNIAYMYAVDKILNDAHIENYTVFIQQRRTKAEEVQLFRDILYSRVKLDGFDYVVIDALIRYVQLKLNVKNAFANNDEMVSLTDMIRTRSKLSEAGISLVEPREGGFEIAFDWQRLVQWKIIDRDEITENTFRTMLERIGLAVEHKDKSVDFGGAKAWSKAFNFFKLLEYLGISFDVS